MTACNVLGTALLPLVALAPVSAPDAIHRELWQKMRPSDGAVYLRRPVSVSQGFAA